MRAPLSSQRAMDVLSPFTIYRVIGRRPGCVYVDENRSVSEAGEENHRLWDLVFEEDMAAPGDQLQDRAGGLVLVTTEGELVSIRLTAPAPRSAGEAFTHAEKALLADRALVEDMIEDGRLSVGPIRRTRQPLSPPPLPRFGEDHPLVTPRVG